MLNRPQICREVDDRQIGPGNNLGELAQAPSGMHPDEFLVAKPSPLGRRNDAARCTGQEAGSVETEAAG
jgi:hypothetical protein